MTTKTIALMLALFIATLPAATHAQTNSELSRFTIPNPAVRPNSAALGWLLIVTAVAAGGLIIYVYETTPVFHPPPAGATNVVVSGSSIPALNGTYHALLHNKKQVYYVNMENNHALCWVITYLTQ